MVSARIILAAAVGVCLLGGCSPDQQTRSTSSDSGKVAASLIHISCIGQWTSTNPRVVYDVVPLSSVKAQIGAGPDSFETGLVLRASNVSGTGELADALRTCSDVKLPPGDDQSAKPPCGFQRGDRITIQSTRLVCNNICSTVHIGGFISTSDGTYLVEKFWGGKARMKDQGSCQFSAVSP